MSDLDIIIQPKKSSYTKVGNNSSTFVSMHMHIHTCSHQPLFTARTHTHIHSHNTCLCNHVVKAVLIEANGPVLLKCGCVLSVTEVRLLTVMHETSRVLRLANSCGHCHNSLGQEGDDRHGVRLLPSLRLFLVGEQ